MKLKVLVACEESQAVCNEFRRLGHEAFSCDLQECSGGHPEWHIQKDCFSVIDSGLFHTCDGLVHCVTKWDLVIAHPPCTYLANSGKRWLNESKYGSKAVKRKKLKNEAVYFFTRFTAIDCEHVAIENPMGCMEELYRKSDQKIHPWMFGDKHKKTTCLWLKNLPCLVPEITEEPEDLDVILWKNKKGKEEKIDRIFHETRFLPAAERRKIRSKTFPGIARAIAEQWSEYILSTIR